MNKLILTIFFTCAAICLSQGFGRPPPPGGRGGSSGSGGAGFPGSSGSNGGMGTSKILQCYQSLNSVVDSLQAAQQSAQNENQLQQLLAIAALNSTLSNFYEQCEFALDMLPSQPINGQQLSCAEYETTVQNLVNTIVNNWSNYASTLDNIGQLAQLIPGAANACNTGSTPSIPNGGPNTGPSGPNSGPNGGTRILQKKVETIVISNNNRGTLNENILECVKDVETLIPQAEALVQDLKARLPIQSTLKDLIFLLVDTTRTVADCGIAFPPKDEEYLNDTILCLEDAQVIEPALLQIADELETRNYSLAEVVEQLKDVYLQGGQKFFNDCGVDAILSRLLLKHQCVNDVSEVIEEIVKVLEESDPSSQDLSDLIQELSEVLEDCKK